MNFLPYIKIMRPKHFIKNSLVFIPILPMIFQNQVDMQVWSKVILVSMQLYFFHSACYILNDFFDMEHDRKHPLKKDRPLASGAISSIRGFFLATTLLLMSIICAMHLGDAAIEYMLVYFLLFGGYCLKFKKIIILDAIVLLGFYLLRMHYGVEIFGGGAVSNIVYVTSTLALVLLIICKREAESRTSSSYRFLGSKEVYTERLKLKLYCSSIPILSICYVMFGGSLYCYISSFMILSIIFFQNMRTDDVVSEMNKKLFFIFILAFPLFKA